MSGRLNDIKLGESSEDYCKRHQAHVRSTDAHINKLSDEALLAKFEAAYIYHKSTASTMTKIQFITELNKLNKERIQLDNELHALEARSNELSRLQTLLMQEWGMSANE